jgi:hypothetical protein
MARNGLSRVRKILQETRGVHGGYCLVARRFLPAAKAAAMIRLSDHPDRGKIRRQLARLIDLRRTPS